MAIELRIASPCEEPWESMRGDERVRFCDRCRLNVFNVQELTEAEVRVLLAKADGVVCGRVYQRRDGTVLTRDCPAGLAKLRRKALAAAGLIATLLVALVSFRLGAERSGPWEGEPGWFSRLFERRFVAARETLRDSPHFGPLIDELSPRPRVMGRVSTIRVLSGSAQP